MGKVYAAFERIENAKTALGRIKKESWNSADLTVIYSEEHLNGSDDYRFELANECFLDTPTPRKIFPWPSLEEKEIEGIGKVRMASSLQEDLNFEQINKELLTAGLEKNKVVAIIEADDKIISGIQPILGSEGAEILS